MVVCIPENNEGKKNDQMIIQMPLRDSCYQFPKFLAYS